jgi:hypothetical protein
MRGVTAIETEGGRVFAHHAVDRVGVHAASLVAAFSVVLERPEQRPVDIGAVAGLVQIGPQPGGALLVDRQRIARTALPRHTQASHSRGSGAGRRPSAQRSRRAATRSANQPTGSHGPATRQSCPRPANRAICAPGFFENAAAAPSSRLIAGRSTSPTGLRGAWPWRTRCL